MNIPVNGSDSYDIRCTPAGGGIRTAILSVTSDDASSGMATSTKTVTLNCTGSPTIQNNTLTGFGNQRVNTTSTTQDLTISNPSGAASFTFTATPSTDFVLSCPSGDPSCFTARFVPGGSSAIVRVAYAPTVPGLRNGAVTITSGQAANSPKTVPVSGTGIRPLIDVTTPLAFGNVPVLLAGGATLPLQIRNTTGTDALVVASMAITGTTDISFAFGTCTSGQNCAQSTSIPAGGLSNAVTLRCDPSGTGPRNGNLTITSDSNDSPTAMTMTPVSLTCNGTQPNVMVSPTTSTFGPQRVGTPSVSQPFTITNPSGATVGQTSYTVSSVSTEFTFTCSGGCTGTLAPGDRKSVV